MPWELLGGLGLAVVALLGLLLGKRRPRVSAAPPPEVVAHQATADERERQIDIRLRELDEELARRQAQADAYRAQADAVEPTDADAVADLMNQRRP